MNLTVVTTLEGSLDRTGRERAAAAVRGVYREVLGERTLVLWRLVPTGSAFTANRPSEVAMAWITTSIRDGIEPARREAGLHALARAWAASTGTTDDQVMIALVDSSFFRRFLAATREQMSRPRGTAFMARLLGRALSSYARQRQLITTIDF